MICVYALRTVLVCTALVCTVLVCCGNRCVLYWLMLQSLPFVEYELHKQLVNKLKIKGMNSLFRLKIQISVGVTQLVAVAVSQHTHTHVVLQSNLCQSLITVDSLVADFSSSHNRPERPRPVMFITTATAMYCLGHGLRTLPAVPRSTQPSTLRGTVK